MKNYDIFEDYLEAKKFDADRRRDDGCVYFRLEETTENGANVVMVISFYDEIDVVDLEIYNLAKLINPVKESEYLQLINDLNLSKRFAKYMLSADNSVKLFYSYYINEQFTMDSAQKVFDTLVMLYRNAEEAYPQFMKIQWA